MGYRLHYAKKYDVQYGGGYFNHNSGAINELLKDLVELVGGYVYYNQESIFDSDVIEIDKTYFIDIIEHLRENNLSPYVGAKLDKALKDIDYTQTEFIDILQGIYENSAPDISYVRLEWY